MTSAVNQVRRVARIACLLAVASSVPAAAAGPLRAGAAAVDVSPRTFPVEVNGSFLYRMLDRATGPLKARAVVLERDGEFAAIVVVDSCMVPRDVCDEIKTRAAAATGIPTERMLVAATHTHSAPSLMDHCLGTMRDDAYTAQLIPQVAEAIALAHARLGPALAGAAAVDAWDLTFCRRWIKRSDRVALDPFGQATVRAMMHPNPVTEFVGPAGPVDPALTVLSVVRPDGRPVAVVANFSMHYLGGKEVSPDYFGPFADAVERGLEAEHPGSGCVAMMSQGTSGDLHRNTYDVDNPTRDCVFHEELARRSLEARRGIAHVADAPLAMAQAELTLERRVPDAGRLAWARRFEGARGDRRPKTLEEVYAMQAEWLHEHPRATLVLQAVRVGDLAITALPNEVYGITGLKLKRRSPLPLTMNIELANGAEGYIPPPEQHVLGGYTTWPASTAGLEVEAEPRIVEVVVGLLEKVGSLPPRPLDDTHGPAARAVLDLGPHAYWRLEEMTPPRARDAAGERHAEYEAGVAVHLPGVGGDPARDMATAQPALPSVFSGPRINRAAHCAGGRIRAALPDLGRDSYSVSLWLWNGYPVAERPVTGYVLSRGAAGSAAGDHLGIGGTDAGRAGRIIFSDGERTIAGRRPLGLRTWHHVVLVREGRRVRVHLDGAAEPDLEADLPTRLAADRAADLFMGGRSDAGAGLEGKVDEVAVFDRPLTAGEVGRLFAATGRPVATPPPAAAEPPEVSGQPAVSDQPALEPEAARERMFVPPGFELEVVAAEPEVFDPVAFDWDASGRLWVVEMADYPLGMDGRGRPGGRIRVLEDADGDGRYETSTLFADGLNFPNGCLTWRDGVIVTAAPEILLLADTDGDGRADRREVLVSGLAEANQQLRPNGLRWGLDNWVYVASGSPGGWVDSTLVASRSGRRLAVGSRDFRFRPDTGELEPEAGPTQFGRNRDDWGRWFGTQNVKPLWHYVLAARYTARNPFVASGTLTQPVLPADVAVHPAQPPEKRYHNFHQAGHYTSACGGVIHGDPRLFGADEATAFVCEPFHNLVQRVRLKDAGVSFAGEPVVEGGRDFLTSTDRWFRPVMVRTGPDGAVWVADMYRFMIEHPDWLPAAGKDELLPRYRHGDDRGRIYRITASGAPRSRIPDLGRLDGPGLVALLGSENAFVRDKAHQMLLWRGGDDAVAALRGLARDPSRPLGSLHAACVLEGLGRLAAADLLPMLAAPHPGLRENALRLAEPWLTTEAGEPAIVAATVAATADPDPRVRLQAALACGASDAAAAGEALGRLLVAHGHEPFMDAAIMTAAPPHAAALATAAAATPEVLDRVLAPLVQVALGTRNAPAVLTVLASVSGRPGDLTTTARLERLLEGLAAAKTGLPRLRDEEGDSVRREAGRVAALLDATVGVAERLDAPVAERLAAARIATRSPVHRDRGVALLAALLSPTHPPQVQQGVVRALAASGHDAVPGLLAAFWPQCSPSVRPAVLEAWLGRPGWCQDLLERMDRGELKAAALDASARSRLVGHGSKEVARLARRVLGTAAGSRAGVIERYRPALELAGDGPRGLAVYRRVCASCHRHGGEGREIGPDVRTFAGHPPEKLLANIFDPSADIQPGYHAFVCTLDSGEQLYGIVTAETDSSVRFKCADASEKTILRSQIESLHATNVSFMPEGLEAALAPGDVADLIAFLKQPAEP